MSNIIGWDTNGCVDAAELLVKQVITTDGTRYYKSVFVMSVGEPIWLECSKKQFEAKKGVMLDVSVSETMTGPVTYIHMVTLGDE
jgi:hypothetical protein